MAERPIYLPVFDGDILVREVLLPLHWHAGFAASQKRRNVAELHAAAGTAGYDRILEVSTKSMSKIGRHLSAFHLSVMLGPRRVSLESAFQGSKIFERGGPFVDLYLAEPKVAKRDPRLRASGKLVAFEFGGEIFPNEPVTAFYDWLYVNTLLPHREWLRRLRRYSGFSDIEFNPNRSVNCQARSCALFVGLSVRGLLMEATKSPGAFLEVLARYSYSPRHLKKPSHQLAFDDDGAVGRDP